MEVKDIFLAPVYLVIIYVIALYFRPKVTNSIDRRYYLPALSLKLFGAVALGLVYTFYYEAGDTTSYHWHAEIICEAFWKSPTVGLKLLFSHGQYDPAFQPYVNKMFWYKSPPEFFVARVAAFFGLFCFSTYTVMAMFFGLISFSGMWAMFRTFLKMYPGLHKQIAIAMFFVPSVFFWGSGLMKDSLCLGALGWLMFAFYQGLIEKRRPIRATLIILIASYTILTMKGYILLSFAPPAVFWVFTENGRRIKNKAVRWLAAPVFLVGGLIAAVFGMTKLTEGDTKYDLDQVAARTKVTSDYIYRVSVKEGGSAYKLGETDGTLGSMLKLAPQAINVSLFRPYLWEVRNPIMLLSSLESTLFLLLTLSQLIRTGVFKTFRLIAFTPLLMFSFIFALVFSMAVGLSTNNFGSLARYKVQMMPFYLSAIFIVRHLAEMMRQRRAQAFAVA